MPPRVLVATVVYGSRLHALARWAEGLAGQQTDLRWDVLLAAPKPVATPELHRWVRSTPFGAYHRVRLRSPADDDEASALPMGKFRAWTSYEALLMLDLDVWMPARCLQNLYEADAAWAAASSSADRVPIAPLACALLTRTAVEDGAEVHPTYVPGAWWERITPGPAASEAS